MAHKLQKWKVWKVKPKAIYKMAKMYVKKHNIKASDDEIKHVVGEIFKHLDANHDGYVSRWEVLRGVFRLADSNQDGKWSGKEMINLIGEYAKFLKIRLPKGWGHIVMKWLKMIGGDKGVTL